MSAPVSFKWLVAPPQSATSGVGGSGFLAQQCQPGYYWDGQFCQKGGGFIICAPGFDNIGGKCVRRAAPAPPPAGSVRMIGNHTYRSRWLIGYDPSKNTCEQVSDFLNAAIRQGEQNAAWPWTVLVTSTSPLGVALIPWPAARLGMPYPTANACLLYVQGTWKADQDVNLTQLAASLGPNARLVDSWDTSVDLQGLNPVIDLSGTGCSAGLAMTFNSATGTFSCAGPSTPYQVAPFTTVVGNVYRSRWLLQTQPAQGLNTCDQVLGALQQFIGQANANAAFPWSNMSASLAPPSNWDATRSTLPYAIEDGWCLFYVEATARTATTLDPNQSPVIPGVRVLDMWNSMTRASIKPAPQPPPGCTFATGCTYQPLTDSFAQVGPTEPPPEECSPNSHFNPTTGACECDAGFVLDANSVLCVPVAGPGGAPPPMTAGAKKTSPLLWVGLGALALGGIYLFRGAS